ncbi:group III truncated hemoglobin [uncultured Rhodoblastus sp.]|uniref:group III truncated hemoglobin n=1 Tax=uncultured Rhodoblastus sp. TaxID=543037 RepID=UPI0025FF6E34|nr:group III truncated hemoglobin [uncultured Rhodoblastus sp.]
MPSSSRPHPSGAPDVSPLPLAQKNFPNFPLAESGAQIAFAGLAFSAGDPAHLSGLFALTRRIGAYLYPALIGEAEDMAAALAQAHRDEPVLASGLADGIFWIARGNARQRHHILRDLVGKYDPPLNGDDRKGRAAPEIAAFAPDRASDLIKGEAGRGAEPVAVSEKELRELVRAFYAEALQDPLIGKVFARNVADWNHHFDIVQNFWSRALLGTTRYTGSPFTPHLSLGLKPEFFDRWIALFQNIAKRHLQRAAARVAIARVEHMSVCFQAGLFPPKMSAKSINGEEVA